MACKVAVYCKSSENMKDLFFRRHKKKTKFKYSVLPSSYGRILECDKFINRNAVMFLSPNMKNMMDTNDKDQAILSFHTCENDESSKFMEFPKKELFRKVFFF